MSAVHEIPIPIQGCLESCERCCNVLDAITQEVFAGDRPDHQPIGAHLRHALEHMICFVRGLPEGIVDYDSRDRDAAVESDPELFRKVLHESMDALRSIPAARLGDVIRVRQTVCPTTLVVKPGSKTLSRFSGRMPPPESVNAIRT